MIKYLFLVLCLFQAVASASELKPADAFGDEMVLQRGMPVPIWGKADPEATVSVSFAGQVKEVKANKTGDWMVKLEPMQASAENRVMTVSCGTNKVEFKDVLVGEVWICSGQSNMEMGISLCVDGQAEVAKASYPNIRLRYVNKVYSPIPLTDISGSTWRVCTPQNIVLGTWNGFSGTAYFFGRELYSQLQVPIGLIQSAWGGTVIEPWTAPDGFRMVPNLKTLSTWVDKANDDYPVLIANYLQAISSWEKLVRQAQVNHFPSPPPPLFNSAISGNQSPTALYNGMIAPWVPYAIRGAIWYQGETNCNRHDGMRYRDEMEALILGWRKAWDEGDFPFYFVQLAPFTYGAQYLPEFWEAQQAALSIPNTGMAHTQDIGIINDVHAKNKQDVGKRLARLALSRTYSQKFVDDTGPSFKSFRVNGNALIVEFNNAQSGLCSRDGKSLTCFEIAGNDGNFVPAEADIVGNTVQIKSTNVPMPTQMRFAWSETSKPNLMNGDKLPAAAFRVQGPSNPAPHAP